MSTEPYGYALLHDQLEGNGEIPDWEILYLVTERRAKHDDTTIEADIKRQIGWEVEVCGRDHRCLAVVEVTEPMGISGRYTRKITFTDIKLGQEG